MKRIPTFADSFAQLLLTLQDQSEEVGVRFKGVATHVIDIRNFYLVPLNRYRLMHIMERPGIIMSDYSEYATVIYFSIRLGRHARGRINLVNPDRSCNIFAMDYGVTDAGVKPDKIFNMYRPEADVIPGLAQLCELSLCHPRVGTDYTRLAQDTFRFFMGRRREALAVTVMEKNNDKFSVLVQTSICSPYDVSTALAYCNHSRLGEEDDDDDSI